MSSAAEAVEQLFAFLAKGARKPLFGRPRFPLDDALRCAYAAWASGLGDELILAALLQGVEARLPDGKLPSLGQMGFSPQVLELARDEEALAILRRYPFDPAQPVPGLESYRALVLEHLSTSSKDP